RSFRRRAAPLRARRALPVSPGAPGCAGVVGAHVPWPLVAAAVARRSRFAGVPAAQELVRRVTESRIEPAERATMAYSCRGSDRASTPCRFPPASFAERAPL